MVWTVGYSLWSGWTELDVPGRFWVFLALSGTETQDNWTWFIENLRKAIGDPPLLGVSSDACKGLANAVKAVFAHVEQMECFKHLMENYMKRFTGAKHMYPTTRTYKKIVH
jgi:transposase-like protein